MCVKLQIPVKALTSQDASELDSPSMEIGVNEVEMCPY